MDLLASFALSAEYNLWMNKQIYSAAGRITDEERRRDRGAFFGSIHATLNHLLLVDRIWTSRISAEIPRYASLSSLGPPPIFQSLNDEQHSDFEALRAARRAVDQAIINWVAEVLSDDLEIVVRYSTSKGVRRAYPLWALMAHLFNHQTHHRGQITTLLAQVGTPYGETDLLTRYHLSNLSDGDVS